MPAERGVLILATAALLLIGSAACGFLAQEQPPEIRVNLAVTSGLPNPGWTLTEPEDFKELREYIKGLPETAEAEEPQFGGFLLTADEARCQFPARVRVFDGILMVTTADRITRYFEDAKDFEQFLRDEAEARGLSDFLNP